MESSQSDFSRRCTGDSGAMGNNRISMEMTTQSQVRAAFWDGFPAGHPWRKKQSDGDYCADCRMEFVDFVDMLHRDGIISDRLAQNVTLKP